MQSKVKVVSRGILTNRILNWSLGLVGACIYRSIGYTATPYIIMVAISIIFGISYIKRYDQGKVDLLALESFKQIRGRVMKPENRVIQFIVWCSKKGSVLLFLILLVHDPVLVVIYYRPGEYLYNGFGSNYIRMLFITSALVGNLAFMLLVYLGFSFAGLLWTAVQIYDQLFFYLTALIFN